ncbi:hypothetical protein C8R45DRAFT_944865 [Mycena sanguinolenta]|nr:hypothetical protein C8R45DRAFT_944865 [Mycena sanguinolenta]
MFGGWSGGIITTSQSKNEDFRLKSLDGVRQIAELGLRPAIEELGQAERTLTPGISFSIPPRRLGLVAGGWWLGGEEQRKSANEALVCRPERPRLGGPPERSEGGEGPRMVGPLRAHEERPGVLMADHRIVVGNLNSDSGVCRIAIVLKLNELHVSARQGWGGALDCRGSSLAVFC